MVLRQLRYYCVKSCTVGKISITILNDCAMYSPFPLKNVSIFFIFRVLSFDNIMYCTFNNLIFEAVILPTTKIILSKNPSFLRYSVIPTLGDILSESAKEKVTRITLAVFRNLIEKPQDPTIARDNCIQMVQCKVSTGQNFYKISPN